MGRKVPSRKHRGVADPEKQRQERESKIKNKLNAPPSNHDDDQSLPKSVQNLMRMRQLIREGKYGNKKKQPFKKKRKEGMNVEGRPLISTRTFMGNIEPKQPGATRDEKVLPFIEQKPWEKDMVFLNRVHRMCEDVLKETSFEKKYKVQVKRNPETGQVENLVKASKDEVDEMLREEAKKARIAQDPKRRKSSKKEEEQKLAKEEKAKKKQNRRKDKREKLLRKAAAKAEERKGESKHEVIRFGEVADRPPELKVLPRKAIAVKSISNLICSKMLVKGKSEEEKKKASKNDGSPSVRKSVLSGKRKDLTYAQRQMLEQQQKNVIEAYRLLKAKKEKSKLG